MKAFSAICLFVVVSFSLLSLGTFDKSYAEESFEKAVRLESDGTPMAARISLVGKEGPPVGAAFIKEGRDGLLVTVKVKGLAAGWHGMHFHEKGDCSDQETFKSAGGHIMFEGQGQGFLHDGGPHAGNLPNLFVMSDGSAEVEIYSNLVTLDDLFDEDGSALVVHELPDDYMSLTAAGSRIACGVVQKSDSTEE